MFNEIILNKIIENNNKLLENKKYFLFFKNLLHKIINIFDFITDTNFSSLLIYITIYDNIYLSLDKQISIFLIKYYDYIINKIIRNIEYELNNNYKEYLIYTKLYKKELNIITLINDILKKDFDNTFLYIIGKTHKLNIEPFLIQYGLKKSKSKKNFDNLIINYEFNYEFTENLDINQKYYSVIPKLYIISNKNINKKLKHFTDKNIKLFIYTEINVELIIPKFFIKYKLNDTILNELFDNNIIYKYRENLIELILSKKNGKIPKDIQLINNIYSIIKEHYKEDINIFLFNYIKPLVYLWLNTNLTFDIFVKYLLNIVEDDKIKECILNEYSRIGMFNNSNPNPIIYENLILKIREIMI